MVCSNSKGSNQTAHPGSLLLALAVHTNINPTALRKAKIVYNFGLSECNRVKQPHCVLKVIHELNIKEVNLSNQIEPFFKRPEPFFSLWLKLYFEILGFQMSCHFFYTLFNNIFYYILYEHIHEN